MRLFGGNNSKGEGKLNKIQNQTLNLIKKIGRMENRVRGIHHSRCLVAKAVSKSSYKIN